MDGDTNNATVSISFTESARVFIDNEVARRGLASREECVAKLIEEAQQRQVDERRLRQALRDGINSGPPEDVTAETWAEHHRELDRRLAERAGQ